MTFKPLTLTALIVLATSSCAGVPSPSSGSQWQPVPLARFKGTTDYELGFRNKTDGLSAHGDFNGDGMKDLAVMAEHSETGEYGIVAFVSRTSGGYSEHIIRTYTEWFAFARYGVFDEEPGTYETACSKGFGSRHAPCPVKFVTVKNDCFSIFLYESGGSIFYWKDNHFEDVWISD